MSGSNLAVAPRESWIPGRLSRLEFLRVYGFWMTIVVLVDTFFFTGMGVFFDHFGKDALSHAPALYDFLKSIFEQFQDSPTGLHKATTWLGLNRLFAWLWTQALRNPNVQLGSVVIVWIIIVIFIRGMAFAALVRRMHDMGHSGGWLFLLFSVEGNASAGLYPVMCPVVIFGLMVGRGDHQPNCYGPVPGSSAPTQETDQAQPKSSVKSGSSDSDSDSGPDSDSDSSSDSSSDNDSGDEMDEGDMEVVADSTSIFTWDDDSNTNNSSALRVGRFILRKRVGGAAGEAVPTPPDLDMDSESNDSDFQCSDSE